MNTDHRLGSFAAISETFPVAIRDIAQAQWRRTTAAPPSAQEMAVLLSRFTQWISHGQSFVVRRGSAIEQFFIANIARGIISGVVVGCARPPGRAAAILTNFASCAHPRCAFAGNAYG